jgi:deoxyribose-phosphate aldolase
MSNKNREAQMTGEAGWQAYSETLALISDEVDRAMQDIEAGHAILPSEQALLAEPPEGTAIAGLIDHTLLLTQYTPDDAHRVCDEALEYGFASVCVNPIYVPIIVDRLQGSSVKPASVVGFIFGAEFPEIKIEQASRLIQAGARELDMVIAVGLLKAARYTEVGLDLKGVIDRCHGSDVVIKVILETGLLTMEEKIAATVISKYVGADYVKTCTGFAPGEATVDDIELMRRVAGASIGVKAAGGVRSYEKAMAMVHAGASRIGATQGVAITESAMKAM